MRQKAFVAYEENMRIPMVISNPILFPDGESSQELATLVDILPTLADMVKVDVPTDVRGVSLLPIIETGEGVQEEILFTFDDTKSGSASLPSSVLAANRLRSIRTKEWKYTYYFDALGSYYKEFELYNLLEDKDEVNNLAYNPKFKEIRKDLHKRLKGLEKTKLKINEHTFVSFDWVETNANFDNYAFNSSEEIMNKVVRGVNKDSSNKDKEEI
jgi:arylsulfatase A-like enzyme